MPFVPRRSVGLDCGTQAWSSRLEAMEASPIQRPIMITGMPRSGSSFLYELLAEDPDNRAPRVWEVMFPIPIGTGVATKVDPRVQRADFALWCFRRLAPRADAVYPMRAWTPHECVAIHSYTFLSEEFVSTCYVPTYETFFLTSIRSIFNSCHTAPAPFFSER